jgi:predicted dehydrogenase
MIKVGVIGFGYWGPNLVRNFTIPGLSRASIVVDRDPSKLERAADRFPGIATSLDLRDVWNDSSIEAVAIATPVATHYDLARAALNARKHVFVEKPMTQTVEHAERLLELAAAKRRVLMVDHTFVYTPAVRRLRELIQSGVIGQVYYYDSLRINLGLFQHDVNVLWDLAVHDLSILDYVLDARPLAVSAVGVSHVKGAPENVAYLSLFLPGDLIAHINVNWLAPVKVRQTLIGGSKKMVVFDDLQPSEKLKIYDRGITFHESLPEALEETLVGYRTGDMWAPNLPITEALHIEALHFLACIDGHEAPITGGEMGLRLVRILELATRSMSRQGAPIQFPGA